MTKKQGWWGAEELPPGSDEREQVAIHAVTAGGEPEMVITDWKDYDEDHSDKEHHDSWGSDVDRFYRENHQPEAVYLKDMNDDERSATEENNQGFWANDRRIDPRS